MTFRVIEGGKKEWDNPFLEKESKGRVLTKEELAEKRKEDNEKVKRIYRLRKK